MEAILFFLAVMAVASIFVLAVRHERKKSRERREALEGAARVLRFSFSPDGDDALLASFEGRHFLSVGHAHRMLNLMRGEARGGKVAIFDHHYLTGSHKHRRPHTETTLAFDLAGQSLPLLYLRPENVLDKIGSVVGFQDIDFEGHPDFSKRYVLRAENEQEARRVFRRDLIAFFEKERDYCMECGPGYFILYRDECRVEPAELRAFLERGERALDLVTRAR